MTDQTIIALDIGRSAVKAIAVWREAGSDEKRQEVTIPSVVSLAIPIQEEATAAAAERETVEVDSTKYFIGNTARLQSAATSTTGLSDDWIEKPDYRALVLGAIKHFSQVKVPGLNNPFVVVGTPANLFGTQRVRLQELTAKAIPGEVRVLSQPMGAYFCHITNRSGVPVNDLVRDANGRKRSWAVIEVGHFSTDFLLMKEGAYIESKSESCEGIYLAAEHLSRILTAQGMKSSMLQSEESLRTRTFRHFGEHDVGPQVDDAISHVVAKIMAKAEQLFADEVAGLDGVLLAGGGASAVAKPLRDHWANVVVLENPRMSVAEGFVRFAKGTLLKRAYLSAPNSSSRHG